MYIDYTVVVRYNIIMESSKEKQRYDKQWDLVDTYFNTNEPEGFGATVTDDEAEALKAYYFIDHREQDVYKHREFLVTNNPELVRKAKDAVRKIAVLEGLSDKEIKQLFS